MPRPLFTASAALLDGSGLLAGIVSLAVPWGRYRVSGTVLDGRPVPEAAPLLVFQLPGGTWYLLALGLLAGLLALGLLAGLLAIAALDTGRAADLALTVAPTLGILTAVVVVAVEPGARSRRTVRMRRDVAEPERLGVGVFLPQRCG